MKRPLIPPLAATVAAIACFAAGSAQAQQFQVQQNGVGANGAPGGVAAYWKAKAQCWAELSESEASQGDTHGTADTAAGNAGRIRQALAAGVEPQVNAEQPIYSQKYLPSNDTRYGRPQWRADIEYIDSIMQRYAERRCRTPKSGCLEVARQSVNENMEETQGARWNHGRPEIDKALALAQDAAAEFETACALPRTVVQTLPPKPPPPPQPLETIALPADMLFAFDRGDAQGLLPNGRKAISTLAAKINGYGPRAASIAIVGHSDRLGAARYNQTLSEKRARTVADLLRADGVRLPIQAKGVGSADPVTGNACKGKVASRTLIECLQLDRRVVVRIMPAT